MPWYEWDEKLPKIGETIIVLDEDFGDENDESLAVFGEDKYGYHYEVDGEKCGLSCARMWRPIEDDESEACHEG